MNKNIIKLLFVFLISTISSNFLIGSDWDMYSIDKNVFVGTIIFPKIIKTIPQISVYRRGLKIKTENENSKKKIQFTISEDTACRTFYMLITKSIIPDIEENTVKYLKINPSQDYNLYELTLYTRQELTINPYNKQEEIKEKFLWDIKKRKIDADRILPDDTLIILFNPKYIDRIEGGNNLELPKIIIKESIFKKNNEEKKMHNEINEIQLSTELDLNILHISPSSKIKPESGKKVMIAMSNFPE